MLDPGLLARSLREPEKDGVADRSPPTSGHDKFVDAVAVHVDRTAAIRVFQTRTFRHHLLLVGLRRRPLQDPIAPGHDAEPVSGSTVRGLGQVLLAQLSQHDVTHLGRAGPRVSGSVGVADSQAQTAQHTQDQRQHSHLRG